MLSISANAFISWRPGDGPNQERRKDGEEEKHERESTKEGRGKRDLSAPSRTTGGTPKRHHKLKENEGNYTPLSV